MMGLGKKQKEIERNYRATYDGVREKTEGDGTEL